MSAPCVPASPPALQRHLRARLRGFAWAAAAPIALVPSLASLAWAFGAPLESGLLAIGLWLSAAVLWTRMGLDHVAHWSRDRALEPALRAFAERHGLSFEPARFASPPLVYGDYRGRRLELIVWLDGPDRHTVALLVRSGAARSSAVLAPVRDADSVEHAVGRALQGPARAA